MVHPPCSPPTPSGRAFPGHTEHSDPAYTFHHGPGSHSLTLWGPDGPEAAVGVPKQQWGGPKAAVGVPKQQ